MPVTYTVDPVLRIVRTRAEGVLTEPETTDLYRRIREDPAFHPTFSQLCDLTVVDEIQTSAPFLRELARQSIFAPGARRAFVTSQLFHYGLARMLQSFCELEGSEIGVFKSLAEAEQWLGLAPTRSESA
jgi:hypothetical protein